MPQDFSWVIPPEPPRTTPQYMHDYWHENPQTVYALSTTGEGWQTVTIGDIIRPYAQYTSQGRTSRRQWRITHILEEMNDGRGYVRCVPRRHGGSLTDMTLPVYWSGANLGRPEIDAEVVWRSGRVYRRDQKPYFSSRRRRYAAKREYVNASNT